MLNKLSLPATSNWTSFQYFTNTMSTLVTSLHHATYRPSCGHDSEVTHQTGSLYLEQLTNTKYANPCQPKIHQPQQKIKYLHRKTINFITIILMTVISPLKKDSGDFSMRGLQIRTCIIIKLLHNKYLNIIKYIAL